MTIRYFAVRVTASAAGMVKRGEAIFIPRCGICPCGQQQMGYCSESSISGLA